MTSLTVVNSWIDWLIESLIDRLVDYFVDC